MSRNSTTLQEVPALRTSAISTDNIGALIEARDRLTIVTHLLRGWVWETDVEHRFTYVSDSVLTYTGRPPEWHYGYTRKELKSYYIQSDNLIQLEEQLRNHSPFGPFEYERTDQGQTYWVRSYGAPQYDDTGAFIGYRGVAHDASAEINAKLAEVRLSTELEMSECVLRGTMDCFPTAISVFNNEYQLVFANAHYYSLLNLSESMIPIGTRLQDLLVLLATRGEIYGANADDAIAKQIAMITSGEVNEYRRTRPNGTHLKIVISPLPCGGFIKTYTDITSDTEMKAKLEAANRQLLLERSRREACEMELHRASRALD